jgi:catechol 2,3-dioxygenase-like lactoylglutathione lyase family enzyme
MTISTSSTSASTADGGAAGLRSRLGRLAGVSVAVPDPDATADFLSTGLAFAVEAGADGTWTVLCEGDYGERGQAAIVLQRGDADGVSLREVTFEVGPAYDWDALRARLAAANVVAAEQRDGVAFADPGGVPLAVVAARDVTAPTYDALRPRRLGHLNLKAPDAPATAAFYADVLGLRLSEQIGEGLYFLRIATEHHNVGLRGGERGELHHLGFELSGWHLYQPLLDRLSEAGYTVEYGPGRHRPGNNLFTYVVDPSSGLRVELFADMAHIPDETSHVPRRWEAGDRMTKTINRWGPTPPPSFLA